MSKADSKSTTSRARRTRSDARHPDPVAQLALDLSHMWEVHDTLDRLMSAKAVHCEYRDSQIGLWEHMRAFVLLSSFQQASSLDGALFQLGMIDDALATLVDEMPEDRTHESYKLEGRMRRLIASAITAIEPHCDPRIRKVTRIHGGSARPIPLDAAKALIKAEETR